MTYKQDCLKKIEEIKVKIWYAEEKRRAYDKNRKPLIKFDSKAKYMKRIEEVYIDIIRLRSEIKGYNKALSEFTSVGVSE